jgi:hypothetical protein
MSAKKAKKKKAEVKVMTDADIAEFRRRFKYDPEEGLLINRETWHSHALKGVEAGCIQKGDKPRRFVIVNYVRWLSSRIIYAIMTGEPTPADRIVDHIDGNSLNDRWKNLRLATHTENQCNRRKMSNNTSGVSGVNWNEQCHKWRASIQHNGTRIHLGRFTDKEDAIEARRKAELHYHKEFRASAGVQK